MILELLILFFTGIALCLLGYLIPHPKSLRVIMMLLGVLLMVLPIALLILPNHHHRLETRRVYEYCRF